MTFKKAEVNDYEKLQSLNTSIMKRPTGKLTPSRQGSRNSQRSNNCSKNGIARARDSLTSCVLTETDESAGGLEDSTFKKKIKKAKT